MDALEQWTDDVCIGVGVDESFRGHFDCSDVRFWLTKFIAEIEQSVPPVGPLMLCEVHGGGCDARLGKALLDIKARFGLACNSA